MVRQSCYTLIVLIAFSSFAAADLKIKTRTTVQGHTSEGTVYIKGARERNEMSYGGRGASATITQCDQKRIVTVMGDQCMVMSMGGESSCPARPSMSNMMRGMAGGRLPPGGFGPGGFGR